MSRGWMIFVRPSVPLWDISQSLHRRSSLKLLCSDSLMSCTGALKMISKSSLENQLQLKLTSEGTKSFFKEWTVLKISVHTTINQLKSLPLGIRQLGTRQSGLQSVNYRDTCLIITTSKTNTWNLCFETFSIPSWPHLQQRTCVLFLPGDHSRLT